MPQFHHLGRQESGLSFVPAHADIPLGPPLLRGQVFTAPRQVTNVHTLNDCIRIAHQGR